jgi:PAS domain S-box-containing protein
MTKPISDKRQLKAFINAAQYLAGLTSGQNIWEESVKVLVKIFGADFAAFGRQHADGAIEIDPWAFSEKGASARLPEPEIIAAVSDVFDSSFLTFISIPSDDPAAAAFFPVLHENKVIAVMLAGHLSASPLENATLDLYLAVAGLIGATYSRKISETAVLQAKNDWERTFEAVPDTIALLDLEYRIVRANKSMAAKMSLSPEECIGLKCYDAICGESAAPAHCPYKLVLEQGRQCTVEMHDNRLAADYLVTVSPLCGKDGRLVGGVHVARDITARKRAEKELEQYRMHLEDLVEERTSELTAANQELESFSYSVSHDLRAPLRHVSGFVKLLQNHVQNQLDEKARHYMAVIAGSTKRMSALIDDLLNFSRLGRSEMTKKNVNLNDLVKVVLKEIQEPLNGRNIKWEIDELPDVVGDESLLKLAFINLGSNAVKFTSTRPEANIRIGCTDYGDEYIFSIADNGVGFDQKYADKLFGVFQRLHTQDEFEGTGIGLANVQRIINRHGGRVWAEGIIGQGAIFYFTLPKTEHS